MQTNTNRAKSDANTVNVDAGQTIHNNKLTNDLPRRLLDPETERRALIKQRAWKEQQTQSQHVNETTHSPQWGPHEQTPHHPLGFSLHFKHRPDNIWRDNINLSRTLTVLQYMRREHPEVAMGIENVAAKLVGPLGRDYVRGRPLYSSKLKLNLPRQGTHMHGPPRNAPPPAARIR